MSTFTYKTLTALTLTGALLSAPAFAEDAHHPEEGAATPAITEQATPAAAGKGMGMMGDMDMTKMHEIMQKMHGAKTPEERQKLRAEHRTAMHAGQSVPDGQGRRHPAAVHKGHGRKHSGHDADDGTDDGQPGHAERPVSRAA